MAGSRDNEPSMEGHIRVTFKPNPELTIAELADWAEAQGPVDQIEMHIAGDWRKVTMEVID